VPFYSGIPARIHLRFLSSDLRHPTSVFPFISPSMNNHSRSTSGQGGIYASLQQSSILSRLPVKSVFAGI